MPTGLINLGVAENSLLTEWLIDYFSNNFKLQYSDMTYGTALGGSTRLFKALRHLCSVYFHAKIPVSRDHVIAVSFASLSHALGLFSDAYKCRVAAVEASSIC